VGKFLSRTAYQYIGPSTTFLGGAMTEETGLRWLAFGALLWCGGRTASKSIAVGGESRGCHDRGFPIANGVGVLPPACAGTVIRIWLWVDYLWSPGANLAATF
jgi:hypothetical protein